MNALASAATLSATRARPLGARGGRARVEQSYRAAVRHTGFVRFLRAAIPVGTVVSLVLLVVWPFLDPFRTMEGVTVGAVRVDGTRVTMEQPRLNGYRSDNRPYEMTAETAVQDLRRPTIIELDTLTARVGLGEQGLATVQAKSGVFDSQKEQMQLTQDVLVRTDKGQEARLRSADIDFKAGTVTSREPVTVTMTDLAIAADRLDVVDNGGTISFTGNVRAVIQDSYAAGATVDPSELAGSPRDTAPPLPVPAAPAPPAGIVVIDPATGRILDTGPSR